MIDHNFQIEAGLHLHSPRPPLTPCPLPVGEGVLTGLGERGVEFMAMNLFEMNDTELAKLGHFDKWLVDPPRDGAIELMKSISDATAPRRIVYVSCSPSTLARDAEVLVHVQGYALKAAGVMNMFPQTSHVESIAVFERE